MIDRIIRISTMPNVLKKIMENENIPRALQYSTFTIINT